jgi:hypothetical protein
MHRHNAKENSMSAQTGKRSSTRHQTLRRTLLGLAGLGTLILLLAACGTQAAKAPTPKQAQVFFDILAQKPNGPAENFPAYEPSNLIVPANSLVTITIHNYDIGSADLDKTSPFSTVKGTVGGVAYADGTSYSSLDAIAHTFTIPQLNLNVPLPSEAAPGADFVTVSFTIHTGAAGTYTWQCYAPCGTDPNGWGGPMATMGYMRGTLTIQG